MHSLSKGVCPSGLSGLSMISLLVAASIASKYARSLSALPPVVCLGRGGKVSYNGVGTRGSVLECGVVVCVTCVVLPVWPRPWLQESAMARRMGNQYGEYVQAIKGQQQHQC